MQQCKICEKEFETLDSLRKHNGRVHKINSQEFYNETVLNGEIPKCKCGCGETPTFITFTKGYNEWIRGHIARVNNNWGHNQKAIDSSAQTRREQYTNGEREVWNKGLTKETDERLRTYGELASKSINNNKEELKRRSEWLQHARKYKKEFKAKSGKDSPRWKGGTSTINQLVRSNHRLYKEWIYPILVEQHFECQQCKSTKQLEVHHCEETMSNILNKLVDDISDYTFEEKKNKMDEVIDYHVKNKVKGEVLCKVCHMKHHPSYNF